MSSASITGAIAAIADHPIKGSGSKDSIHLMGNYDELFSVTVKNTKSIIEMLLTNELYCAFIEGIFDKITID